MFCKSLRKTTDKIKGEIVNSRALLTIPNGNNIQRKVSFAAICMLAIVVLGLTIGAFGSSKTIVYASSVNGFEVGIYRDQACTDRIVLLDWGPVEAGSNCTLTIYVKNEGDSAVSLWLATSNWAPSSSSGYMSLNWSYSGQILSVGQVIPLELTLTISPIISGITGFSFDTIITTSEG